MTTQVQPLVAEGVAHTLTVCSETFHVNGSYGSPQAWPEVFLGTNGEPYDVCEVHVLRLGKFNDEIVAALSSFKGKIPDTPMPSFVRSD